MPFRFQERPNAYTALASCPPVLVMAPYARLPHPNWATAPLTPLPCPHVVGGNRCGNNVLGRIKFPPTWTVYAIALEREDQASGQGPVKPCGVCHGWVEVIIRARPADA